MITHSHCVRTRSPGVAAPSARSRSDRRRARRGLTLIELVVGIAVLVVGVSSIAQVLVSSIRSSQKTRELGRATVAAQQIVQRIEAEAFADAFRRFNADPADDPGGAGTAPGANFAVEGLNALPGDADGRPGEVLFPTVAGAPGILRENIVDADLGMPRDLNGDNAQDALDHSLDYRLLPLIVRVRWRTASGPASFEIKTMLANF